MARSVRSPKSPPRRRRDAESARAVILDAAEQRLVSAGPAGIRLQEVASDVGMSHPTVLHHFGSREALVRAVITRAVGEIHSKLVETIRTSTGEEGQIAAILDGVFEALAESGRGRVLLWLALEGHAIDPTDVPLSSVVDALQAMHQTRGTCREPSREETAHVVVLVALTLIGSTVLGPTLLQHAGLAGDAAAGAKFRRWVAQLLAAQLETQR